MYKFSLKDPLNGHRENYPVFFKLKGEIKEQLWLGELSSGEKVLCQKLEHNDLKGFTEFVAVVSFNKADILTLIKPIAAENLENFNIIKILKGKLKDCFVRLNTANFDLELCSGTAQGEGSSKWGIKKFKTLADGVELLPSGNNAIGGFYGPFFTPENGLINPPEHTKVDIDVIESGPVYHFYKMKGKIPNGLLEELNNKNFEIEWKFFAGSYYFERRYIIDDFSTVINGRSVVNKITVGDEFESGQGNLVFDRFNTSQGVCYRAGDPYAGELVKAVADTIKGTKQNPKFKFFQEKLKNIESAHWDLYWRLFSSWEKVISDEEIRAKLKDVRKNSHRLSDLTCRNWIINDGPVDVNSVPEQTIFQGPATKSVEFDHSSKRAMVWWTSKASGAFQIVQRAKSGWVNWGTNGENECPELPVGVRIKTAYGKFADYWQDIADSLETEVHIKQIID